MDKTDWNIIDKDLVDLQQPQNVSAHLDIILTGYE